MDGRVTIAMNEKEEEEEEEEEELIPWRPQQCSYYPHPHMSGIMYR